MKRVRTTLVGSRLSALAIAALLCGGALALADATTAASTARVELGTVSSVTDGDTLRLGDGRRVRLLQIDAPELGSGECYSRAARTALLALAPVGSRVTLESDPRLDRVDRYGRILRYVKRDSVNVNLALVQRGAAAPYFYGGERGKYAARLLTAAKTAKAAKRGLWSASPATQLDPTGAVETGTCGAAPSPPSPPGAGSTSRRRRRQWRHPLSRRHLPEHRAATRTTRAPAFLRHRPTSTAATCARSGSPSRSGSSAAIHTGWMGIATATGASDSGTPRGLNHPLSDFT